MIRTNRMAKWFRLAAWCAVPLALGASTPKRAPVSYQATATKKAQAAVTGLRTGQRAPRFSATDVNGKTQSLQAYLNRVVVLHFWTTWCPTCQGKLPQLQQVQQRFGGRQVVIVSVSLDDDPQALRRFLQTHALPYAVIEDAAQRPSVAGLYQVDGFPTTYLIDRQGLIVERLGAAGDLMHAVLQALAAPHA